MTIAVTLSRYISRQFTLAVLAMLSALSGLVALFDFIELLRRSATKPDATFGLVTEIAALRLPYIAMQILPFAVMLGGILAFWRLTRSSELIVARAAGVSAWGFLAGPVLCALLLGATATAALSPLSSVMLRRAEMLDNVYLRTGGGPLALSGGQLWMRQSDNELAPGGVADYPRIRGPRGGTHAQGCRAERVPAGQCGPSAGADRGQARNLGRQDLDAGGRARGPARPVARAAADGHAAYRSDGCARAGQFCVPRHAFGLGAARLHRASRPVRIFLAPASVALPGAAGSAAACRR